MAREPRLDAPGSMHHVIVRGIERRRIFESDKDREDFLTRLGQVVDLISEKFGVTREEVIGGGQRQAVSVARSVFCYLTSKDLGLAGRELSRALRLTPAAIHYAVLRGERFLAENKEGKVGLAEYLNNLTTSP